ncbi:MAG: hypothetical protein V3S31_04685 [Dehalococcoidia bacterium]
MRVLELSDETGAAAACARLFARWGNEVVKVVRPDRVAPDEPIELYLDGGKQRVALDFRRPQDRAQIDGSRGYDQWVAGPRLGQQSAEVLRDILQLSEPEIAGLFERGIVYERPPDV